jgi:hypothetical protein
MPLLISDEEFEEEARKRARESVINQALEQVSEFYHYMRRRLSAMPKGLNCAGCPYWDDLKFECLSGCTASFEPIDWERIDEQEKESIAFVRRFLGARDC